MHLQVINGTYRHFGRLLRVGDEFETNSALHKAFPDKFRSLEEPCPKEIQQQLEEDDVTTSAVEGEPPPVPSVPRRFVDNGIGLLVVGYWTENTPYEHEAYVLSKTLDAQGLNYDLRAVPNLGSWQKNTQYKPTHIRQLMEEYPTRPLLYLDVDCVVLRPPKLVQTMPANVDFAVNISDRRTLHSGTLYFGPTDKAKNLVDVWIAECRRYPEVLPNGKAAWDQRVLQMVLERRHDLHWKTLPVAYCYIIELSQRYAPGVSPILLHTRGALRFKRIINGQGGYEK